MPNNVERSTPFNSESHIWLPQFFYSRWLSALSSIRNDPEGAKCPKQSLSPRPLARVRQPSLTSVRSSPSTTLVCFAQARLLTKCRTNDLARCSFLVARGPMV
jgi:hypothetical protein